MYYIELEDKGIFPTQCPQALKIRDTFNWEFKDPNVRMHIVPDIDFRNKLDETPNSEYGGGICFPDENLIIVNQANPESTIFHELGHLMVNDIFELKFEAHQVIDAMSNLSPLSPRIYEEYCCSQFLDQGIAPIVAEIMVEFFAYSTYKNRVDVWGYKHIMQFNQEKYNIHLKSYMER